MTEAEALARLQRMVAATEEPTLTVPVNGDGTSEVEDLLNMCRLADADGLAPSDDDWTPTWDLNRGAAEGWRWKAGKIAARFDFTADGASFSRSQLMTHCQDMANQYRRRIVSNVILPGTLATEA